MGTEGTKHLADVYPPLAILSCRPLAVLAFIFILWI